MPSGVYERKPEPMRTTTGEPPTCPEEIIVEHRELARAHNLSGWTDKMDRMHGEGNWGDDELIRDIQQKKWEKLMSDRVEPLRDRDLDSCMEGYMESFDNVTPNDEQSLYQLCILELEYHRNARKLANPGKMQMKDIKMLSDIQGNISREHRLLQDSLGISRKKRRAKKEKAFDVVMEHIEAAREWVDQEIIQRVEHCDIQLGFVLYHFEELPHRFEFRCPKCKELVVVEGGDEKNLDLMSPKL